MERHNRRSARCRSRGCGSSAFDYPQSAESGNCLFVCLLRATTIGPSGLVILCAMRIVHDSWFTIPEDLLQLECAVPQHGQIDRFQWRQGSSAEDLDHRRSK